MSEQKDLTGRRIVLTRAREQSADWRRQLEARGATVLELPLLQVTKDIDKQVLADCLTELGTYEWLLFTSANGVRFFFEEFHRLFDDIRSLGVLRIGVVGEATAAAVRAQHLRVELMPDKATGEALAKALLARESMDSAKVLIVTGNRNRDTLVSLLDATLDFDNVADAQITAIEILSPSNKADDGRAEYRRKQAEYIHAGVNLVEIDLLRDGMFTLAVPLERIHPKLRVPYMACVRRVTNPTEAELYRFALAQKLLAIPVPLRPTDRDVRLDLQQLIEQCYQRGRYGSINYQEEAIPPLIGDDKAWADRLLREAGKRK